MKFLEQYVARGKIGENETVRINVFNGRYDHGVKIVDFKIIRDRPQQGDSSIGILATEEDAVDPSSVIIDFEDNRQVAWSHEQKDGYYESIIDPENLIVEDLYFTGVTDAGTNDINYMVVMDRYALEPFQGPLSMVNNRSQG
jgi:hypothetical protein